MALGRTTERLRGPVHATGGPVLAPDPLLDNRCWIAVPPPAAPPGGGERAWLSWSRSSLQAALNLLEDSFLQAFELLTRSALSLFLLFFCLRLLPSGRNPQLEPPGEELPLTGRTLEQDQVLVL